ncbi:FtsX-like permease family protein [Candidatus Lokiarchaeum ossiferum]
MKSLIPFYFRLTFLWVKKSYLIILSVSISLAMIFATNCMIESGIAEDSGSHLETNSEFLVTSSQPISPNPDNIANDIESFQDQFVTVSENSPENQDLLKDFNTFPYLNFRSHWSNFGARVNLTDVYDFHGIYEFFLPRINFLLYSEEYYQNERFTTNFKIIEGRVPQTENEVLVPYTYKLQSKYELNDSYDLTYFIGNYSHPQIDLDPTSNKLNITFPEIDTIVNTMQLESTKIVGFYAFSSRIIELNGDQCQMDLTYQKILEGETDNLGYFGDAPLFFYSNFSQTSLGNHPVYQFYDSIVHNESLYDAVNDINFGLSENVENLIHYGISLMAKLDSINYNQIISYENRITKVHQLLQKEFSHEIYTRTYGDSILRLRSYIYSTRFLSIAINLPLILFTFLITYFSMKNAEEARLSNFLQMSIKGMTKKQITAQIIQEIIILSLISMIISVLLGMILFYPIRTTLTPLFFPTLEPQDIKLVVNPLWLGITFLFGFIIIGIAYSHLLKILKKTEIQDIYELQNQEYLAGIYDENSTYGKEKVEKRKQSKNEEKYEDSVEGEEKKIRKISYFLFPFILIPIFIYGLAIYSGNHEVSDNLRWTVIRIYSEPTLYLVFGAIFPIFIVGYGFYRFLIVESPRRFAKLSKFLSKPFHKEINYLVGLEMIRRKEFRYIIILISVYVTSILILNPFVTSSASYPMMIDNGRIGADIAIDINIGPENLAFQKGVFDFDKNLSVVFQDEKLDLENHLCILSQKAEVYSSTESEAKFERELFYLNYSEYLSLNSARDQYLPTRDLIKSIQKTISYNEDPTNSKIGIIVGNYYEYSENIKDNPPYFVNLTYFNFTSMQIESTWLECEFIARTVLFPGVYDAISSWERDSSFFIDVNAISQENCSILAHNYVFMGNLEEKGKHSIQENSNVNTFLANNTANYEIREMDYSYLAYSSSFAVFNTKSGYSLYSLLLIGFTLCFGQGILFIQNTRDNFNFYGNLLTRGVSRKQVYLFGLSQLLLFFLISLGIALITVIAPIILALKIYPAQLLVEENWQFKLSVAKYPILINWPLLGINLASIFVGSILLYTIFFKTQRMDSFFAYTKQ